MPARENILHTVTDLRLVFFPVVISDTVEEQIWFIVNCGNFEGVDMFSPVRICAIRHLPGTRSYLVDNILLNFICHFLQQRIDGSVRMD